MLHTIYDYYFDNFINGIKTMYLFYYLSLSREILTVFMIKFWIFVLI